MAVLCRNNANVLPLLNNSYCKLTALVRKVYNSGNLNAARRNNTPHILNANKNIEKWTADASKLSKSPFECKLKERRDQALKSILIEIRHKNLINQVQSYCQQFGYISSVHHYETTNKNNKRHYVLIEFSELSAKTNALSSAVILHRQSPTTISSCLLFRYSTDSLHNLSLPFNVHHHTLLNGSEIEQRLRKSDTISQQMSMLYDMCKLDDTEVRLRFLIACQIENCLKGLFPHIVVYPFGSSLNGFGKQHCDLDLVVILQDEKHRNTDSSNLIFQTKQNETYNHRAQSALYISLLADMMSLLLPGVSKVRKITKARVPIVKFTYLYTDTECDLSMFNMTAIYMTELLSLYGEIDERVRPLVFTIRRWAQCNDVTKTDPIPMRITNFSLSLLVLFYLQQKSILPTVNALKQCSSWTDVRYHEEENNFVDCTFARNVTSIRSRIKSPENIDTLEELLCGFFEFFATCDFNTNAICLRSGHFIAKRDDSPLYIVNPLEPMLNVSKNVQLEQVYELKEHFRRASYMLNAEEYQCKTPYKRGILSLFHTVFDADVKRQYSVQKNVSTNKEAVNKTDLKSTQFDLTKENLKTFDDTSSKDKKKESTIS